jgi:hypothetical protein
MVIIRSVCRAPNMRHVTSADICRSACGMAREAGQELGGSSRTRILSVSVGFSSQRVSCLRLLACLCVVQQRLGP